MSKEAKERQHGKNSRSGKYKRAFQRTVLRTGRWRGHKKTLADAK